MDTLQVKNPLYPLVCILSALVLLAVGLFYAKHPLFPAFILAVCLLYCAFGLWQTTVKCVALFLPVSLVFALFSYLFLRSPETAVQTAGRVLLMGVTAVPMVTLPPINLTRCLTGLGVPRMLTLGMLIAIRFVPVVGGEIRRVREAMRVRGVRRSLYRAFVVPVMIRLVSMSDIMAVSLETRAFGGGDGPASVYRQVSFHIRDGAYCAAVAVFIIGWVVVT